MCGFAAFTIEQCWSYVSLYCINSQHGIGTAVACMLQLHVTGEATMQAIVPESSEVAAAE